MSEFGSVPPNKLNEFLISKSRKDIAMVTAEGKPLERLPHGCSFRPAPTHVDERGSLVELFDPRWNWHPAPVVFAYSFTVRPGIVKGWNLHKLHEDRYVLLQGELELVFYDVRPDSPTFGEISRFRMTVPNRGLINVPANVWHADRNIGTSDAVVINFPTIQYNHADPDKYRLPLDTPLIPYDFGGAKGG